MHILSTGWTLFNKDDEKWNKVYKLAKNEQIYHGRNIKKQYVD